MQISAESVAFRLKCLEDPKFTPDDFLIDVATTCSDAGLRLTAEKWLRKRYPSKVRVTRRTTKQPKEQA